MRAALPTPVVDPHAGPAFAQAALFEEVPLKPVELPVERGVPLVIEAKGLPTGIGTSYA